MGGLSAGAGSMMSGNGFMTGVKNAAAFGNVTAGMSGIGKALTGDFSGASFANMKAGPTAPGGTASVLAPEISPMPTTRPEGLKLAGADSGVKGVGVDSGVKGVGNVAVTPADAKALAIQKVNAYQAGPPKFGESIKQAFMPGDDVTFGQGLKNAFMPNAGAPTASDFLLANNINPISAPLGQQATAQTLAKQAGGGLMRKYGPAALLGTAGVAAAGGFKVGDPEPAGVVDRDEDGNVITGTDIVEDDPSSYMIADIGDRVLDDKTGEYITREEAEFRREKEAAQLYRPPAQVGVFDPANPPYRPFSAQSTYQPPVNSLQQTAALDPNAYFLQGSAPEGPFARPFVGQTLADGGQVFPRRNGGIMPEEGIPNQDSVRAMLMPGEFVMTTDAVKGLGNGNMNEGIKNMYSVMRNLENRGRATA